MDTVAPSSDIISAIPRPRPVPPPVMNATFPSRAPSGSILVLIGGNLPLDDSNLILSHFILAEMHLNVGAMLAHPPWSTRACAVGRNMT